MHTLKEHNIKNKDINKPPEKNNVRKIHHYCNHLSRSSRAQLDKITHHTLRYLSYILNI